MSAKMILPVATVTGGTTRARVNPALNIVEVAKSATTTARVGNENQQGGLGSTYITRT